MSGLRAWPPSISDDCGGVRGGELLVGEGDTSEQVFANFLKLMFQAIFHLLGLRIYWQTRK